MLSRKQQQRQNVKLEQAAKKTEQANVLAQAKLSVGITWNNVLALKESDTSQEFDTQVQIKLAEVEHIKARKHLKALTVAKKIAAEALSEQKKSALDLAFIKIIAQQAARYIEIDPPEPTPEIEPEVNFIPDVKTIAQQAARYIEIDPPEPAPAIEPETEVVEPKSVLQEIIAPITDTVTSIVDGMNNILSPAQIDDDFGNEAPVFDIAFAHLNQSITDNSELPADDDDFGNEAPVFDIAFARLNQYILKSEQRRTINMPVGGTVSLIVGSNRALGEYDQQDTESSEMVIFPQQLVEIRSEIHVHLLNGEGNLKLLVLDTLFEKRLKDFEGLQGVRITRLPGPDIVPSESVIVPEDDIGTQIHNYLNAEFDNQQAMEIALLTAARTDFMETWRKEADMILNAIPDFKVTDTEFRIAFIGERDNPKPYITFCKIYVHNGSEVTSQQKERKLFIRKKAADTRIGLWLHYRD